MANIKSLLDSLCIDLGFCLPPSKQKEIINTKSWEADRFACEVIIAEGLTPEYETKWRKEISNKFIEHLGSKSYVSSSS